MGKKKARKRKQQTASKNTSKKQKTGETSRPSNLLKVCEAIQNSTGSEDNVSRAFIYRYIGNAYPRSSLASIRKAITKGVSDGFLEHGSTKQRFKLTASGREKVDSISSGKQTNSNAAIVKDDADKDECTEREEGETSPEEASGSEESEQEGSSEEKESSEKEDSFAAEEATDEEAEEKMELEIGEKTEMEQFKFGNLFFSKKHQDVTRNCLLENWDFEEVVIEQIISFSADKIHDISFQGHAQTYIANRSQVQILKLFKSTGIKFSYTSKENFYDGGDSCYESTIFADGEFCEKIKKKYEQDPDFLKSLFHQYVENNDTYCNYYREEENVELYTIDSSTGQSSGWLGLQVMPDRLPEIIFRCVRLADPMFDYVKKIPEQLKIMEFFSGGPIDPPENDCFY